MEAIMTKRRPNDIAQMNLRLREDLRKRIEAEAKKHGHSLNRELVRRLEQSFTTEGYFMIMLQLDTILSVLRGNHD